MNNNNNNFWVEKYRPKSLSDIVLTDSNDKIINKFVNDTEIPNLLLYGNPGTGKTSLAKILVDVLDAEHLLLNCSEVGIDTVRTTITQFSQTKSFNGKMKIVICDEMDSASSDAQRGLRNTMEENARYCRYILTSNYINRIIQPLQSRCQSLLLAPPIEGIIKRIGYIIKNEHVEVDSVNKTRLVKLVKRLCPDTRKSINEIQKHCIDGKLVLPEIDTADDFALNVLNYIIKNDVLTARKYVIEHEIEFNADYPVLIKAIFDTVCNANLPITSLQKKMWLMNVGEYMYRGNFVVDPEINFYCMLLALSEIKN